MGRFSKWLKKYFIPHEHNNFKPHFLRHESMLFVFFVIIIIELGFLVQVFIVFDKTNFLASVLPGVLTMLTNEKRAENNVAPLVQNDLLIKAAQLKAEDMATRGYFAHVSPDGKTPWYWLEQVGYHYSSAGENLAVNFFESDDVAQAWMNSPTHRENIVKKNYTEIGIGIASGVYQGSSTVFVAQFFGTPIALASPSLEAVATQPKISVITPLPTKVGIPTQVGTTPAPAITPKTVTVAPTTIQILGEETNSAIATMKNTTTLSGIKSFIQKVLASPREYVTYVYGGILILIILAMLLAIFIKSEMRHPLIIARGVTLVAIILFLLFVNIKVLHLDTKVPTDGLSATVIASR
ncbi:hypothetical protein A2814_01640 [Candidatus Nomurabacteria bacterium RIFCSPHIGHO2_01_FULL_38_19]|uniref:SCP domain-containing protein n=1 Tax=Candidatus Nomurabacteria bacterium RIFCSPHIGHO2_01_FULL_38_19 TaxID=1801732 RepID=A0A1F6UV04_9BACT|nr:MAG: hypothetical protein A2814_01640 [Candidatus Nomurabacteria bacterium RIFCSPHIGHO2_01_FULL_38_19]